MQVLIIEDEPLIRLLATDILEAEGWTTTGVSTAAAPLAAVRTRRFDAAIIDLGLPDAPGADLVRQLLAARPGLGMVISTGRQADDPLVAAARRAGGDRIAAVLRKPWEDSALVASVRRAAGRHRSAAQGLTLLPCLV